MYGYKTRKEYAYIKARKGLYFTTKERAFEVKCKQRKLEKSQPNPRAAPTQNINRQPTNYFKDETITPTKPEEKNNKNRLKTDDPTQEKSEEESKQREDPTNIQMPVQT